MKKFDFSFLCGLDPEKMPENQCDKTRYCSQCDRNIVNFTGMDAQQIIAHTSQTKKACGYMMPWQFDDINTLLASQAKPQPNALARVAKLAAVVSSPLLLNSAAAQDKSLQTPTEQTATATVYKSTEIRLTGLNGEALVNVRVGLYENNQLIRETLTDSTGRIYLDAMAWAGKTLVVKGPDLNIEKTFALTAKPVCYQWQTSLDAAALPDPSPRIYDLQFVLRKKSDNVKQAMFRKVEIELYDTANNIIETLDMRTNMSGYTTLDGSKLKNVDHLMFIVYTNKGRKTSYMKANRLLKDEVNVIEINTRFRRRMMGAYSF